MIIVFDIGNTNITAGVFNKKKLIHRFCLKTDISFPASKYCSLIRGILRKNKLTGKITGCIIGSVVPGATSIVKAAVKKCLGINPILFTSKIKFSVKNKYKNKKEVGDDRLANAVAGRKAYPGKNLIIIDFGTTITFDVVNKRGDYMGGVIMPGLNLSKEILFTRAEKLPQVEMKYTKKVVGNTTKGSIQSGVVNSTIAGINYLLESIKKELRDKKAKIILTGGEVDKNILKRINVSNKHTDKNFTLKGFKIIYDLNTGNRE